MTSSLSRASVALFMGSLAFITGCGGREEGAEIAADSSMVDSTDAMGVARLGRAVAQLSPTQGNNVTGMVSIVSEDETVRIEGDLSGLAPGRHGFHIHENGDCSAPDASSAGGHFNPTGQPHGAPDSRQRHVGDLGNIEAGSDSTAHFSRTDSLISMTGLNSVIHKAVVVHANADDLTTQPSGNAGPRVACGVIRMEGEMDGEADTTGTRSL